uniref:Uncharacterized protein n=1 Tax=Zea mays TaxID=4577 RepID=A0A804MXT1_MAIZE
MLTDGDVCQADGIRLRVARVRGTGYIASPEAQRDKLEVGDVGEHGERGGLRWLPGLDVGRDHPLRRAVVQGDQRQGAGVVPELLHVVLHGPRHDAAHIPSPGPQRRDHAAPVDEPAAPARHLVGEGGVRRDEEGRHGPPDGRAGDPRRRRDAVADVGAQLLPHPLECPEGEHEAVGEGGGHRADVVGEDQAAEEVAVEGLGEVRAEEHLAGAAALRLGVPHVGLEVPVTVHVGGRRRRREPALGLELPAGVNELQRLSVFHGESPASPLNNIEANFNT